jgi:hypothetical protein
MAIHEHGSAIFSSASSIRGLAIDPRLPREIADAMLAQATVLDTVAEGLFALARLEDEAARAAEE